MSPLEQNDLAELIAETDVVEAAIQHAVRDALGQHKRAGNPVAGWENGQLVLVQPEQIDPDGLPLSGTSVSR